MARQPEIFVRELSSDEAERLVKIARTAKDRVRLRRAEIVLTSLPAIPKRPCSSTPQRPTHPHGGPWISSRAGPHPAVWPPKAPNPVPSPTNDGPYDLGAGHPDSCGIRISLLTTAFRRIGE